MAYWLLCQSCKEWSKYTTPLSNDKVCPFCSNSFITVKSHLSSIPYERTIEKEQDLLENPSTVGNEPSSSIEEKETLKAFQETDKTKMPKTAEMPKIEEIPEIEEIPDISATPDELETEDKAELQQNSEITDQPKMTEISETPEDSAIQETSLEETQTNEISEPQETEKVLTGNEKQNILRKKKRSKFYR